PVQGTLAASWNDNPALVAERTVYNAFGDVTSVSAPAPAIASGVAPDANQTEIQYDAFGRANQRIAHTGIGKILTSTTSYSIVGQPISSSTTGAGISQSTTWQYDPANPALVRSVTEPAGFKVSYEYDGANRVSTASRSTGASESWAYDALRRVGQHTLSAPDAATQVSLFEYNRFDQPTFLTFPGHTAAKPRSETRTYDAKGHLHTQSGPAAYALTYEYDASGNMALMRDANGSETSFIYDARNRLAEKRYADGKTWQFTHDAAGNLKSRKDAVNRTTNYQYNNFSRVSNIAYPNDPAVSFAYDNAGRLTGMTDATGTSTWTSDAWNRTTASTQPLTGRSLTFTYNARGQRESLAFAGADLAARTISYHYDSVSRLTSLADSVTGGSFVYSYQPGTRWVSQIQTPSGSATVQSRDALGRITDTAFLKADNQTLNAFAYTYDAAGQRVSEVSQRGNINFAYNGIGELTGADGLNAGNYNYAYDGIGNRLTSSTPATTYTPNNLNQYTQILEGSAPSEPTYDNNGNLTSINNGQSTVSYTYDEENRLAGIQSTVNNKQSAFIYDGLSRRVETRELENGTLLKTIRYVYDGLVPVEELEWSGTASGTPAKLRQITRGPDLSGSLQDAGGIGGLLAFTANNASTWYFADANGNVANLFTPADTAAATYTYDPFGRRLTATGALANVNPYQWSSKEYHEPSGLVYYLYRFYDPQNGRWLSRDPLGEEGGVNLYGFALNDPQNCWDAYGLTAAPTFLESLIPIYGSWMQALNDFECGKWGWGIVNTAFAISDIAMVKSLVVGLGKLGWKGLRLGWDLVEGAGRHSAGLADNMLERASPMLGKELEKRAEMAATHLDNVAESASKGFYEIGEVLPDGRIAGMGPGAAYSGEFAAAKTIPQGIKQLAGSDQPVVVIGRSMDRVRAAADELRSQGFKVQTWNPKNFDNLSNPMEANRSWLRYWAKDKGAPVIDIGQGSVPTRSDFYDMELRSVYEKWQDVNVIKWETGF
ncbi:MAG: RHS repeat-associated core domain-containing protein, partial [Sterolibacterium sp.]